MARKELQARIQLSRYSGSGSGWGLSLTDEASGIRIVDVNLTDEEFARALGSQNLVISQPIEVYPTDKWGKQHEVKRANVKCLAGRGGRTDLWAKKYSVEDRRAMVYAELIGTGEIDGWDVRTYDLEHYNGHNVEGDGTYRIVLERWVDKEEEEEEEK